VVVNFIIRDIETRIPTREADEMRVVLIYTALSLSLAAWSAGAQEVPPAQTMPLASQLEAPAQANEAPALVPQHQGGIDFVSGGLGEGERTALRSMGARYNMRLLFALAGSGEYLADVTVKLVDAHGDTVLDTISDGPLFYARVPPGSYRITVASAGQSQTRSAEIGAHGVSQAFYWRQAK
jgi:hypothetical protein